MQFNVTTEGENCGSRVVGEPIGGDPTEGLVGPAVDVSSSSAMASPDFNGLSLRAEDGAESTPGVVGVGETSTTAHSPVKSLNKVTTFSEMTSKTYCNAPYLVSCPGTETRADSALRICPLLKLCKENGKNERVETNKAD